MSLVGRIEDLALSDIFQILSIGKKTGILILKGPFGKAFIVFKNGLVVRAETDNIESSLGEELLKASIIKDTILNLAIEVQKKLPQKSIPEILYDLGSVSTSTLEKFTRKRIEKVISHLLIWEQGDFQFEPDETDPKGRIEITDAGWEISKGMSPEYLLMEGARVHDESMQATVGATENLIELDEEKASKEDWEIESQIERKDISSLKALTQELRFPNSASEITLLILRFASEIFQRGIIFMVGDTDIVGLGQFGIDIENPDENIRKITISYEKSPFLKNIILAKRPYKGILERDPITESIMQKIGGIWPDEIAFFPIITENKVVALIYCDNGTKAEKMPETEGLEIFIDQAGLALEKSLLQRRLQEIEKKTQ